MFRLHRLLILGILAQLASCSVRGLPDSRTLGLKFGETAKDYVKFKPDMQPLEGAFSVCGWVKELRSIDLRRIWLSYGTSSHLNEIWVTGIANNYIFNLKIDLSNKTAGTFGEWKHHCITWAASSQEYRVYFEGDLIGTKKTDSGTKLGMGGYMALGNDFDSYGGGFTDGDAFGGELFKANVFNRELTAEEIKEMFSEGLCSEVEEKYGRARYLKWSDFLLEERSGNVTEIDVGCGSKELSRWDVLFLDAFYNRTLTKDLINTLRSSWDILG